MAAWRGKGGRGSHRVTWDASERRAALCVRRPVAQERCWRNWPPRHENSPPFCAFPCWMKFPSLGFHLCCRSPQLEGLSSWAEAGPTRKARP